MNFLHIQFIDLITIMINKDITERKSGNIVGGLETIVTSRTSLSPGVTTCLADVSITIRYMTRNYIGYEYYYLRPKSAAAKAATAATVPTPHTPLLQYARIIASGVAQCVRPS